MTKPRDLPILERQVVRVVLLDALERILLFHTREPTAPERIDEPFEHWS